MSRVLIIDDSDPNIVYSGNWILGTIVGAINTREYNSTVHQSATAGDQLTYTFYGTGCSVYGTLDTPQAHGSPSATFSIDGGTPTALNITGKVDQTSIITSHVLLYQSSLLERTTHNITIKTGTPSTRAAGLYIDFLTVSTGSDSVSGTVIVDDRDPSIVYNGPWLTAGSQDEYLGTTSRVPEIPNGGSAIFRFNGTSITVYGTTPVSAGPGTTASFDVNIDGASAGMFNGPQSANTLKHTPFFHKAGLSNTKEHTIILTTTTVNRWYLDYIVYTTENSTSNAGTVGQAPDVGTGGQSPGVTGSPNVGAIAGGVMAGVAAILLIAGAIFIVRRRRRAYPKEKEERQDAAPVQDPPSTGSSRPFNVPFTSTKMNPNGATNQYSRAPIDVGVTPYSGSGSPGNASAMPLLNQEPSSPPHAGAASWEYASLPTGSQFTESPGPGGGQQQIPNTSPYNGFSGHGNQPIQNQSYPRFDSGIERVEVPAPASSYQPTVSDEEPTTGEKAQFNAHNPSTRLPARETHRPLSPNSVIVEEDSGVRIPRTSPPVYTAD